MGGAILWLISGYAGVDLHSIRLLLPLFCCVVMFVDVFHEQRIPLVVVVVAGE